MNRLSTERRAQVIGCLVEGMSMRATARVTGVAKQTIVDLLVNIGQACSEYQDHAFRNLDCKVVEADEIWAYCYSKAKNVPDEYQDTFGYGDVWTWTAYPTPTRSSFRHGSSVSARLPTATRSLRISNHGSRTTASN